MKLLLTLGLSISVILFCSLKTLAFYNGDCVNLCEYDDVYQCYTDGKDGCKLKTWQCLQDANIKSKKLSKLDACKLKDGSYDYYPYMRKNYEGGLQIDYVSGVIATSSSFLKFENKLYYSTEYVQIENFYSRSYYKHGLYSYDCDNQKTLSLWDKASNEYSLNKISTIVYFANNKLLVSMDYFLHGLDSPPEVKYYLLDIDKKTYNSVDLEIFQGYSILKKELNDRFYNLIPVT